MFWSIKLAYPYLTGAVGLGICFFFIIRRIYVQSFHYNYSAVSLIAKNQTNHFVLLLPNLMRSLIFFSLALLIGRPQWQKELQGRPEYGVAILLALDASGSMRAPFSSTKTRFEQAKDEAIAFIKKRTHDQIGLVLFAQRAMTRIPLTYDKKIFENIMRDTPLGIVEIEGTVLSKGIVMAIERLKHSPAKSKVIVLLTDGIPEGNDLQPHIPVQQAQKEHIKIYTIGLVSGNPFEAGPSSELLHFIAQQTGGKMYLACRPQELAAIYQEIDQLEKFSYEIPSHLLTYDLVVPFIGIIIMLLCCLWAIRWKIGVLYD